MAADPIIYCLENLTDYGQFERLCSDIMSQSGYPDIEPLGGSADRGRDAIHVSRNTSDDITVFAYSVRADWHDKLFKDCRRIVEEKHVLTRLVFACTSDVNATERDSVKQAILDDFKWNLDLYDLERLRVLVGGRLRHLLAQHPAIFCPPFFPTHGGLSIVTARDTLVIDHHANDHALATWLARRLQLDGHRVWCHGTAPLAGESADSSIRVLIEHRASRFLPIVSQHSLSDADFMARCGIASSHDGLILPCFSDESSNDQLPSTIRGLNGAGFSGSWRAGLQSIVDSLRAHRVEPVLSKAAGQAIAVRSYIPEPVTKSSSELVYSNVFATTVPAAVQECELTRKLTEEERAKVRRTWAFVEAGDLTLLAFEDPPDCISLKQSKRRATYSWVDYESLHQQHSKQIVRLLVLRSLDVVCARAGLQWCENRRTFYFDKEPDSTSPQRYIPLVHVDGRSTRVTVTGMRSYGKGSSDPFHYQLCPSFRVGQDPEGGWWTMMRMYVRVTDTTGIPYMLKAITRRRKKVTKNWWNKEWFARHLAVMQALGAGGPQIEVGSSDRKVIISTQPLQWQCPAAIDYAAVERIGDFQQELAQLRDTDQGDEEDEAAGEP